MTQVDIHGGAATGAPVAPRPVPVRPRRTPIVRKQQRAAIILIAPFFVLFVVLFLAPLVYTAYLSLFRTRMVGGLSFVWLDNYVHALGDPAFLESLGRVVLILFVQVPVMLALAIFFALALDSSRVRGSKAVRLLVFMPYAVPGVVGALMWGYLYGPDYGPISQVFRAAGLPVPDLLSSDLILGSIMNIMTWAMAGYNMILIHAALRAIPSEIYEAAEIDGAGQIRIAWSIKLPAVRPAIILATIFSVIGAFQLFTEPRLLYSIAPSAVGQSFSPNVYAYNLAFINDNMNYSAAIAFLLGFMILVVSYVVQLAALKRGRTSD